MPTRLEQAAFVVLTADGGSRWKQRLRAHVASAIVTKAYQLLGSPPLDLPAEWDQLDSVDYRAALAGTVEDCAAGVAVALADDPAYLQESKTAVEAAGLELNRTKLRKALAPELGRMIDPGMIRGHAEAMSPTAIWPALADRIAQDIHAAESRAHPQSEVDCIHSSLLSAFFQVSKIPDATRLGATLRTSLTRGRFNVRGSLLRIIERSSTAGIVDAVLPHVAYSPVVLAAAHRHASQLVQSVAEESTKIPAGQGFMIAMMGDHIRDRPSIRPEDRAKGITEEMTIDSRIFRFQQYEYSALSLSAIAASEFCLRCAVEATPALGLHPGDAGQIQIIDALPIAEGVKATLRTVFSPSGPNFRNRSLHGGFLEIESRRVEILMHSGLGAAIGVPKLDLNTDAYIPRNAAAVALQALGQLDAELAPLGLVHAGSTTWTHQFRLDAADFDFATRLVAPTMRLLVTDQKKLTSFVSEAFPCLSVPVRMGLIGWTHPKHDGSRLQHFAFLSVMFEPAMRLICHAAGFPILRRGHPDGDRTVRYRMLDTAGFVGDNFLDWIEEALPDAEKAEAKKTIRLAVRCRDAFAHGAISTFDGPTKDAYGAVLVRSFYLLLTAAMAKGI